MGLENSQNIFTHYVLVFIAGVLVGISTIAYLKRKQNEMTHEPLSFLHVIENTKDFIYYYQLSDEKKFLYISPTAEYFFGVGSNEIAYNDPEVPIRDIHPEDYELLMDKLKGKLDYSKSIIQRWKDKDGKYRWFEEYATPVYEKGKLVALKGVIRNIDEKVELQQKLQFRMTHDALTGIFNRNYFEQKFETLNEKVNMPVAIILCDLDNLKYVNDNFGHKEGDDLIKETAAILDEFSTRHINIARIGGDEMVIIFQNVTEKEAKDLVQRIIKSFEKHNQDHVRRKIKLSIGMAFAENSIGNMTELFSQADAKMYEAKSKRKQKRIV